MNHGPRIITFYSYKGGVGRSMALLNVAYTLQSLGRHVLVIDLDLEAPGVSGFLTRNKELEPHPSDQPDVVDFLKAALPIARWQPGSTDRPIIPKLSQYLRSVRPDRFAPAVNPRFAPARIDVLAANDARDYANRLADLNVAGFSAEDLEELGNVVRDLIARHQFPYARLKDEPTVPTKYDYVLVDSRTGFTETSGLCIGPLSDRLVVFTGLNDQNINGTAEFLRVVGLAAGARSAPWDDQDDIKDTSKYAARIGRKPTLLVASPTPHGETDLKQERFAAIERIIGAPHNLFITYHPRLALFETIFLRDFPSEGNSKEYRELTDAILHELRDSADFLGSTILPPSDLLQPPSEPDPSNILRLAAMLNDEQARHLCLVIRSIADRFSQRTEALSGEAADESSRSSYQLYMLALEFYPSDHGCYNNWAITLVDEAKRKRGSQGELLFEKAFEKYRDAIERKPESDSTYCNWGVGLVFKATEKTGAEADGLFAAAVEKFKEALALNSYSYDALHNWGMALTEQAKKKTGQEAHALLFEAEGMYKAALSVKPDMHNSLTCWGLSLIERARRTAGSEAEDLLRQAAEKFREAFRSKPDSAQAMDGLGTALNELGVLKSGTEADLLFEAAAEKHGEAIRLKPSGYEFWNNRGIAFQNRAKAKEGGEADALFTRAFECYSWANAWNRESPESLSNWGTALAAKAARKSGPEADALFAEAEEKYRVSLAIRPDRHSVLFDLSCLEALRGNVQGYRLSNTHRAEGALAGFPVMMAA